MPAELTPRLSISGAVHGATDEASRAAAEQREHAANVTRLRVVLGVGLLLWNVIGIPNDRVVCETFGLSYQEFTAARVITTALQVIAWVGLSLSPSRRALLWIETVCFVSTAAGLAALHHGIGGPTPMFLSCAMLAQGVAIPRPWREGIVQVGATYLAYPLALLVVELLTGRAASSWSDPLLVSTLAQTLGFGACTLVLVARGADALHALQSGARAEQRVGQYQLLSRVAVGAMGEIWRARHPGLGQEVALKLAAPGKEALLAREADVLVRLSHPVTVRALDRGRTEAGRPYYAMELLRGPSALARVQTEGPLAPQAALAVGLAVARAVAELHALGLVHRDVAPQNVILGGRAHDLPRLVDFGLTVPAGSTDEPGAGSVRFMAPEQRRGSPADPRSDVFALGALLHFLLTGRSPMEGARPELSLPADLAPKLGEVIERALCPDPEARWPDAGQLAAALAACRVAVPS